MGAAVSVLLIEGLPDDIRDLLEECEKRKCRIAEHDVAILNNEKKKMFKKHTNIISVITGRTKSQLRNTNLHTGSTPDDIFLLTGNNNSYGKFMRALFLLKEEVEIEQIQQSARTEYDEEFLITLIGTSSMHEVQKLSNLHKKERSMDLLEVFETKSKRDGPLAKLIRRLFNHDRDLSKTVNPGLAAQQAKQIYEATAMKKNFNEDLVIDIFSTVSRHQLMAVSHIFKRNHNMKLERAINLKFKGSCGKLMLMLALPLPNAVATFLHDQESRFVIDKNSIAMMLAKYDKDFLQQVDEATELMFSKSLISLVKRGLSGNLLNAVEGWIENATPDKGYERVQQMFIAGKLEKAEINPSADSSSRRLSVGKVLSGDGKKIAVLLQDPENYKRIKFLLDKQQSELIKFMEEKQILFNPFQKLSTFGSLDSFDEFHRGGSKIVAARDTVMSKYSMKGAVEGPTDKSQFVYDFLLHHFQKHDLDGLGFFDADRFWEVLGFLPLLELGFTAEEVSGMRDWSEWEQGGIVHFAECLYELQDSVIAAVENKSDGNTDVIQVINGLKSPTQQSENIFKMSPRAENMSPEKSESPGKMGLNSPGKPTELNSTAGTKIAGQIMSSQTSVRSGGRRNTVIAYTSVPLYFLQFLYDTLNAYDFDQNGFLSQGELVEMLPVLNLQLVEADFLENPEATIPHKQAVEIIAKHVHPWFNDKFEDHYICLVDRESGFYFWYNTRDESTQWADEGYGDTFAADDKEDTVVKNSENLSSKQDLTDLAFGEDSQKFAESKEAKENEENSKNSKKSPVTSINVETEEETKEPGPKSQKSSKSPRSEVQNPEIDENPLGSEKNPDKVGNEELQNSDIPIQEGA